MKAKATRLLDEVELAQGGANGPTIRLRGELERITAIRQGTIWDEGVERAAFEAHAPMNTSRRDDFPDIYEDAFVQASWCGWIACAGRLKSTLAPIKVPQGACPVCRGIGSHGEPPVACQFCRLFSLDNTKA